MALKFTPDKASQNYYDQFLFSLDWVLKSYTRDRLKTGFNHFSNKEANIRFRSHPLKEHTSQAHLPHSWTLTSWRLWLP